MTGGIDDDLLLVRGGLSANTAQMVEQTEANFERTGLCSLSFYGSTDRPLADVCRDLPNAKIRTVTVRRIRTEGYDVIKTNGPDHYDVPLDPARLATDIEMVIGCLGEPIPNPGRQPR